MRFFWIYLLLIISMVGCVYSQQISNCGVNVLENANLTQNINTSSGDCLNVTVNNIVLDCKGYSISGVKSYDGIRALNSDNVTIKNCVISNFSYGVNSWGGNKLFLDNIYVTNCNSSGIFSGNDNSSLTNIESYYNKYGIWLTGTNVTVSDANFSNNVDSNINFYVDNSRINLLYASNSTSGININGEYNVITNSNFYDNVYGIHLIGDYSLIDNVVSNYNDYGLFMDADSFNLLFNNFSNSVFKYNNLYNIYFDCGGFPGICMASPKNNSFVENSLGNISKIGANHNFSSYDNVFDGNYYTTSAPYCYGNATFSFCDLNGQLESVESSSSSSSSNIFPFENIVSQLIVLVVLVGYLLYN